MCTPACAADAGSGAAVPVWSAAGSSSSSSSSLADSSRPSTCRVVIAAVHSVQVQAIAESYGPHLCFLLFIVVNVFNPYRPVANSSPVQVVYRKHSTALVFVCKEGEASIFACVPVFDVVHVHKLAVLRKDCQHVALSQVKG